MPHQYDRRGGRWEPYRKGRKNDAHHGPSSPRAQADAFLANLSRGGSDRTRRPTSKPSEAQAPPAATPSRVNTRGTDDLPRGNFGSTTGAPARGARQAPTTPGVLQKLGDDHPLRLHLAELKSTRVERERYWAGVRSALGVEWQNPASLDHQMWRKEVDLVQAKIGEVETQIGLLERGLPASVLGLGDDQSARQHAGTSKPTSHRSGPAKNRDRYGGRRYAGDSYRPKPTRAPSPSSRRSRAAKPGRGRIEKRRPQPAERSFRWNDKRTDAAANEWLVNMGMVDSGATDPNEGATSSEDDIEVTGGLREISPERHGHHTRAPEADTREFSRMKTEDEDVEANALPDWTRQEEQDFHEAELANEIFRSTLATTQMAEERARIKFEATTPPLRPKTHENSTRPRTHLTPGKSILKPPKAVSWDTPIKRAPTKSPGTYLGALTPNDDDSGFAHIDDFFSCSPPQHKDQDDRRRVSFPPARSVPSVHARAGNRDRRVPRVDTDEDVMGYWMSSESEKDSQGVESV